MYWSDKHHVNNARSEQRDAHIRAKQECLDNAEEAELHLQQLMLRCQNGDRMAFEQLYQLTSAKLNGIAYRLTGSLDTANDILQESFLQVWRNCQQYHSEKGHVINWLIGIVRFRSLDRIRADQRTASLFIANMDDIDQFASTAMCADEISVPHSSIKRCLSTLSKDQRNSILMAYLYGHNRLQIAQHLNTQVSTVKSWLRRGLGRLRSCLSR
jgi:RNA polymerase sigma-70 factor, ECF subfamily